MGYFLKELLEVIKWLSVGFEDKMETIKHHLYCHKDQTINILNSLNEQIDNVDDLEVVLE